MKRRFRTLAQAIGLLFVSTMTYASPNCDPVLRPNEEKFASDYALAQAYMDQNAEHEYDRLNKLDSKTRSADASYKLFSGEYNDSNSREEFKERVRSRLSKESFSMSTTEARALSRIFVTDSQISAWLKCEEAAGGGAVLIAADKPNARAFPIKISFMPQTGVGEADIQVDLDGGKIYAKTSLTEKFRGKSSKAFIVTPTQGSNQVLITANVAGLSDTLTIDLRPRVVAPPPPPPSTGTTQPTPDLQIQIKSQNSAENGFVVPVTVDAPHISASEISIYSGSRSNLAIRTRFTDSSCRPFVSTRIKMANSGSVIVDVKDRDGTVFTSEKWVNVTQGGAPGKSGGSTTSPANLKIRRENGIFKMLVTHKMSIDDHISLFEVSSQGRIIAEVSSTAWVSQNPYLSLKTNNNSSKFEIRAVTTSGMSLEASSN